ncbi:MAG: hypothetical protein ACTFAL_13780 [Candidatus Electronema sp. V4]|uniref:hypothetical protein n=1 Tax=Candidatus Electronema sp. V4 TaxID=3454756 RepID=UPI00405558D8
MTLRLFVLQSLEDESSGFMAKKEAEHTDEPLGELRIIDVIPHPPEQLVFQEEKVKMMLTKNELKTFLSKEGVRIVDDLADIRRDNCHGQTVNKGKCKKSGAAAPPEKDGAAECGGITAADQSAR